MKRKFKEETIQLICILQTTRTPDRFSFASSLAEFTYLERFPCRRFYCCGISCVCVRLFLTDWHAVTFSISERTAQYISRGTSRTAVNSEDHRTTCKPSFYSAVIPEIESMARIPEQRRPPALMRKKSVPQEIFVTKALDHKRLLILYQNPVLWGTLAF